MLKSPQVPMISENYYFYMKFFSLQNIELKVLNGIQDRIENVQFSNILCMNRTHYMIKLEWYNRQNAGSRKQQKAVFIRIPRDLVLRSDARGAADLRDLYSFILPLQITNRLSKFHKNVPVFVIKIKMS